MSKSRRINEHTILRNVDSVPYLAFTVLEQFDFIKHGFSTRLGGVSHGIYESMNLGYNRGDCDEFVTTNYNLICNSIGITSNDLVFTHQVHKANVRVVTHLDKGKGMVKQRDYEEIDGHITKEEEVPLLAFAADCVPIYVVDPKKKVIGLTHSGWRGTVEKIGKVTVDLMQDTFGSKKEDMIAVIGPSICKDCYEVSKDVVDAFAKEFSKEEISKMVTQTSDVSFQLDLWKANEVILRESGLLSKNVVVSGVCTRCHKDLLFSHRATNGQRGSNAAFLSLTSKKS